MFLFDFQIVGYWVLKNALSYPRCPSLSVMAVVVRIDVTVFPKGVGTRQLQ
jgi:hypothetical protein